MPAHRLTPACVLTLVAACAPPPADCTLEARSSLAVRVEDGAGILIGDATVNASHAGGAVQACEPSGDSYQCPFYEVAGDFVVAASRAGNEPASAAVTVGADACHVVTEQVLLVLTPVASDCCCAYIPPGDIDTFTEQPAATAAECAALDQGHCIDPTGRYTPHPCCPDAVGDRCG